jgi:hypothetical protein
MLYKGNRTLKETRDPRKGDRRRIGKEAWARLREYTDG